MILQYHLSCLCLRAHWLELSHGLLCGAKELICLKEFYELSSLSKFEIALDRQRKESPFK